MKNIAGLALSAAILLAACGGSTGTVDEPISTDTPAATTAPTAEPTSDYTLKVEKAEAWSDDSGLDMKPDKGNVYYTVLISITANTDDISYNPLFASVTDAEGFEYSVSLFPAREPALGSGNNLAAGKTTKGWLTFEVPKDGPLTLVWDTMFSDPLEVVIR